MLNSILFSYNAFHLKTTTKKVVCSKTKEAHTIKFSTGKQHKRMYYIQTTPFCNIEPHIQCSDTSSLAKGFCCGRVAFDGTFQNKTKFFIGALKTQSNLGSSLAELHIEIVVLVALLKHSRKDF